LYKQQQKFITEVLPIGSWNGKRCFILGGGPSLENFDFSLIKNELTIGINKSFIKFPTAVNFSMDAKFYEYVSKPNSADAVQNKIHEQWLTYSGVRTFLQLDIKKQLENIYLVKKLTAKSISLNLEAGIYGGSNSGLGALMLAMALGANPIYLLGYDMKVKDTKTHWHSGYPNQTADSLIRRLGKFIQSFDECADSIKKAGFTVINLNPDSALICFDKKRIEDII